MTEAPNKKDFLFSKAGKELLALSVTLALIYFLAVTFLFPTGNKYLFAILTITHVYYLWMGLTFWYTVWNTDAKLQQVNTSYTPPVDVFITVAGEPLDVVEETLSAVTKMDYPNFEVYILNDGYVAQKDNWQEAEDLAKKYKVNCITRKVATGAKAGNINNGLSQSRGEFIVIFDADHVPHKDFLRKTIGYFEDQKVGFVQSPQFYKNAEKNYITSAAWEQQSLFFGAICRGRNRFNSITMCGTNMAIRRSALLEVGGMDEKNISEDFLTGLRIHSHGYKSIYVPEVLAEGLAPEDFMSYYKQQLRWSRGNLEVFLKHNPIFMRGLTWQQKLQYIISSSYYLSGIIVLINSLLPLIFFFTGAVPLTISTMSLAGLFLAYIFVAVYALAKTTNYTYTVRAIAFSLGSFALFTRAFFMVVFNVKQGFAITSKKAVEGNFINLVMPHIAYIAIALLGAIVAVFRFGLIASVITNIAWALFYCAIFIMFISAALPKSEKQKSKILNFAALK